MAKKRTPSLEAESEVVVADVAPEPEPAPVRAEPPARRAAEPAFEVTTTETTTITTDAPVEPAHTSDPADDGTGFTLLNDGAKLKHMVFEDTTASGLDITPGPAAHASSAAHHAPPSDDAPTSTPAPRSLRAREADPMPPGFRRHIDELGRPSSDAGPSGANLRPWRRTLYKSTGGSEVSRYQSAYGTSTLVTARRDGGVMREERFHSRLIDPIIQDTPASTPPGTTIVTETVTKTTTTTPAVTTIINEAPATPVVPAAPKKKAGLLGFLRGKHKPGEDSGAAFVPAVPTQPVVVETPAAVTHDETVVTRTTTTGWEPPTAALAETAPMEEIAEPRTAYYDYAGDDHEVIDLEGVGPEYAERLQKEGVYTTSRLCYEDAASLARRIDVPEKTVRTWQAMAQLMKISGVGKQYAEAMARAGITGIEELKERRSTSIAEQVQRYLQSIESTVVGQSVTAPRVGNWKRAAAKMRKVRQAIPPTTKPEKVLARGHIPVLKQRHTKALGPPRKARSKK